MDEVQAGLASRLAKNTDIFKYLCNKDTEWHGIVIMQNTLDEIGCSKYLNALHEIGVTVVNAGPEQRVEAFNKALAKK